MGVRVMMGDAGAGVGVRGSNEMEMLGSTVLTACVVLV